MPNVSQHIIQTLVEAGIEYVFTMPGGGMNRIFDALYDYRDKIKVVLTRNEQTASCMAEMYGRLTGKPGVLIGQGPFVGSAGLFGMMEGFLTSTPMLTITDVTEYADFALHAPFQCGTGEYGALDLPAIFKGTAKYVTLATSPLEAVQGVQLAIKHAVAGRPGPTAVLYRIPALRGELTEGNLARLYPLGQYLRVAKPAAYPADVEKVADRLAEAQRPVIIAGNGVHAAKGYAELVQLAELAGIPVATSYQGKSAIPEVHPLAVGVMNMYGEKIALKTVSEADLLLVLGCRLKPQDTCFESPALIDPRRQTLIQVDIDPRNAGWVFPVEMGLTGDARLVMQQLIDALQARKATSSPARQAWLQTIQGWKQTEGYFSDPSLDSAAVPIHTTRVAKALRDHLPSEALLTLDGGNNRICILHHFASKQAGTIFAVAGIGAMSLSVPSAIAAKLLYPQRPCVALCGDGGMAMQIHALSTAKQQGAAAIFLVMNDSVLGAVRDGQKDRTIGSEFVDTDFVRIAQAFDCQGLKVQTPEEIAPALTKALQAEVPTVIDVRTDPNEQIRPKAISPWAQKAMAGIYR